MSKQRGRHAKHQHKIDTAHNRRAPFAYSRPGYRDTLTAAVVTDRRVVESEFAGFFGAVPAEETSNQVRFVYPGTYQYLKDVQSIDGDEGTKLNALLPALVPDLIWDAAGTLPYPCREIGQLSVNLAAQPSAVAGVAFLADEDFLSMGIETYEGAEFVAERIAETGYWSWCRDEVLGGYVFTFTDLGIASLRAARDWVDTHPQGTALPVDTIDPDLKEHLKELRRVIREVEARNS